jgi:hypothetical protein
MCPWWTGSEFHFFSNSEALEEYHLADKAGKMGK